MDVVTLQQQVEQLTHALRSFSGHRTLWRSPSGEMVHAEPELELEDEGFVYIATLFQPDRDTVTAALIGAVAMEPTVDVGWDRNGHAAELVPAHA